MRPYHGKRPRLKMRAGRNFKLYHYPTLKCPDDSRSRGYCVEKVARKRKSPDYDRMQRCLTERVGVDLVKQLKAARGHDAASVEPHDFGGNPAQFGSGMADIDHRHAGVVA